MCLNTITKQHNPALHVETELTTFKCVDALIEYCYETLTEDIKYVLFPWQIMSSPTFNGERTSKIPVNTWIDAVPSEELLTNSNQTYTTGFHVFPTIEDALQYTFTDYIIKVLVKEVFLEGTDGQTDNPIPTLLARKMFVPWPQDVVTKTVRD